MATAPPPPTYTSQNFDAINDYIGHLANRHRARSALWKSDTFATYAKWSAVVVAAGGLAAFLVLFGLSLYKEKPEPKIVSPVIVDRDIVIKMPENASTVQPLRRTDADRRLDEIKRSIDEVKGRKPTGAPNTKPAKSVLNFVIFKNIEFSRSGINRVTVGMRYSDTTVKMPSYQWCYIEKRNLSGTKTHLYLANKSATGRVNTIITLAEAREFRASLADLNAAQRECVFE